MSEKVCMLHRDITGHSQFRPYFKDIEGKQKELKRKQDIQKQLWEKQLKGSKENSENNKI
jgi:hypothetical protein